MNSYVELWCVSGWAHTGNCFSDFLNGVELGLEKSSSVKLKARMFSFAEVLRDWERFLSDIRTVSGKVTLLGWSLGGMLAMEAWAKSRAAGLSSLILASSAASFIEREDCPFGETTGSIAKLEERLMCSREEALERFYRGTFGEDSWVLNKQHLDRIVKQKLADARSLTLEELVTGLGYLRTLDLREIASGIELPVLILHGMRDRVVTPKAASYLHSVISDAELVVFPEKGHDLFSYDSDEVVDQVVSFLSRQSGIV